MNFIEKRIFIERSEMEIINTYKPCQDLKTIKKKLTDIVKNTFADKWYQLKENTKEALKKFCLLGNKRGLVFIDPKKLANEFGLSLATLNIYLKKLIQSNMIIKLYRRSTKHNGKGAPVYLFVNHPYFLMWADMLGLQVDNSKITPSGSSIPNEALIAEIKADLKAENAEIPCGSKDKETFLAPNSLELKENYNNYNKLNDSLNINDSKKDTSKKSSFTKFIKYVPKVLQHFGVFFGDNLKNMCDRVNRVAKKLNITCKNQIHEAANIIFNQLKVNIKNGKSYAPDELCAYTYSTARAHFTKDDNNVNQVSEGDNDVNQVPAITDHNAVQFSEGDNKGNQDTSANNISYNEHKFIYGKHDNQVNHAAKKRAIREEIVPEWLNKDANTITPKQTPVVSEERKKAIWDQLNKLSMGSI